MAEIWYDVDIALAEVPINLMPIVVAAGTTIDDGVVYNEAGLDLNWNFITTLGAFTQTNLTPTDTGGAHDFVNQANGMYTVEIPASGGTVNNDTEGFGWFTGFATADLPWRGPVIGFRAAAINNSLIDGPTVDVNVTAMAANVLTATAINADAITSAKIADDAIAAEHLATGALTADAFAADAIVSATLATGALTADAFAADAIVAATLATGALTADAFAANALAAATFAASSLNGKGDWNTVIPPTEAQMNARTIVAANYVVVGDTIARVTLVDTTTTNTDMVGTDSGALAAELAKVPKSDSNVTFNATALASINAEVDTALSDAGLPEGIPKNAIFNNIEFLMVDATDFATPEPGLTVTGTRSIDGGAFAGVSGAIAEVANGIYQFDAAAADLNGDVITFKFSSAGAADTFLTIKTSS